MSRKSITVWLSITVLLVAAVAEYPRINFFMMTGRFAPVHKVESLQSPVAVRGWTAEGLSLSDGRLVSLPGIHALPSVSPALSEMTKRGVEMSRDGRVYGLALIHHWCGNDPVREHIARVDISDAMTFLHIGETVAPVPEPGQTVQEPGGRFSEWGWNVSEYMQFQMWKRIKDSVP
jgi:hypothetical protein